MNPGNKKPLESYMDSYFTKEKIEDLIINHNWELVRDYGGRYKLRQTDKHYMTTVSFDADDSVVDKFLIDNLNNRQEVVE